jgi:hypothetical protein
LRSICRKSGGGRSETKARGLRVTVVQRHVRNYDMDVLTRASRVRSPDLACKGR